MSRLREIVSTVLLSLLLTPIASGADGPTINALDVEVEVGDDGVVAVVERIAFEAPNARAAAGPVRQLVTRVDTADERGLEIEYDLQRVRLHTGSDAKELPLDADDTATVNLAEAGGPAICSGCGEAGETHTLEVAYRALGAIATGTDLDRLYWPLFRGADAGMQARDARIAVTMPAGVQRDEVSAAALHVDAHGAAIPSRVNREYPEEGADMLLHVSLADAGVVGLDLAAAWPTGHLDPVDALPASAGEPLDWLLWTLYLLVGMVMLAFIIVVVHARAGS